MKCAVSVIVVSVRIRLVSLCWCQGNLQAHWYPAMKGVWFFSWYCTKLPVLQKYRMEGQNFTVVVFPSGSRWKKNIMVHITIFPKNIAILSPILCYRSRLVIFFFHFSRKLDVIFCGRFSYLLKIYHGEEWRRSELAQHEPVHNVFVMTSRTELITKKSTRSGWAAPIWLRFLRSTRPSADTCSICNLHYHPIILVYASRWCTTLK